MNTYIINIYITEYVDGTFCIEPKHMHYAFRPELNFDNVAANELGKCMRAVQDILNRENVLCKFVLM